MNSGILSLVLGKVRENNCCRTEYAYESGRTDATTLYLVPVSPGVTRSYNKVVLRGVPPRTRRLFNFAARLLGSSGLLHVFGHGLVDQVLLLISVVCLCHTGGLCMWQEDTVFRCTAMHACKGAVRSTEATSCICCRAGHGRAAPAGAQAGGQGARLARVRPGHRVGRRRGRLLALAQPARRSLCFFLREWLLLIERALIHKQTQVHAGLFFVEIGLLSTP